MLGLATIASDVTPELARATIASVTVLGARQRHAGGQGCTAGPHALIPPAPAKAPIMNMIDSGRMAESHP
ncbi:MAG: hypothetical protein R3C69_18285 [Geminicoccaceae bacterium]